MRLPLRPVAVGAALALTLSGCGLLDRAQPTTSGTSSSGAAQPPSETSEDLGTLTGSGRPLDAEGLGAVLPQAGDIGSGWEADPQQTVFETAEADVTPASCAPLLQKGPGWDEVHATQRARVQDNYRATDNPAAPGTQRRHLAVWAYSFDTPYPTRLFDEAGALVADCSSFEVRQPDTGRTSSYVAEPLTFPTLGDATVAFRLKVSQTMEAFTLDFVVVKVGHNTITVANGTYNGTPDTAVTERAARAAVAGLEEN